MTDVNILHSVRDVITDANILHSVRDVMTDANILHSVRDVMTDANIMQGALFHEDPPESSSQVAANDSSQEDAKNEKVEYLHNSTRLKPKQLKDIPKPAVHKGFLARAKGIPALELYRRLAQKKKRKLVLCGHSLGGAVAALATLAILHVVASTSVPKENEKVQIKCITFSIVESRA